VPDPERLADADAPLDEVFETKAADGAA
jgi:hypothetical protein